MEEHSIQVSKTTRYFSIGPEGEGVTDLWIVLHGYGQLPRYFIRNFQFLEAEHRRIVAPEGLHRFYLNGTSGRVGASWMTKEARLDDIEDQGAYLNQLLEEQRKKCPKLQKVVLFGFSQGVATACRWMDYRKGNAIDALLCWAGTFPPDIDYTLSSEAFQNRIFQVFLGDRDEYITPAQMEEMMVQLQSQNIHPQLQMFRGTHIVDAEVLQKKVEELNL